MSNGVDQDMARETVIRTEKLTKRFGARCAVDNVSWQVHAGTIHGVIGPNGAGKTTLQKMLLGITHPSSGSAVVMGLDVHKRSERVREHVAFVPEEKLLYDKMRVAEFIKFYGRFFPRWNIQFVDELLKRWSIPQRSRIRELSKGMRAKLLLAVTLGRRPRLMLMDEPTIDLDPTSADEIFSVLAQWVTEDANTIVLSTHRMDEVERICDHVAIMNDGSLVIDGELDDIRAGWKTIRLVGSLPDDAASWDGVRRVGSNGSVASLVVDAGADRVVERLRQSGAQSIEVLDMNLRSIYLAAVGYERGRLDDILEILV